MCFCLHSRKGRPPHTGRPGPWDPTSAPAVGWSPGGGERGVRSEEEEESVVLRAT